MKWIVGAIVIGVALIALNMGRKEVAVKTVEQAQVNINDSIMKMQEANEKREAQRKQEEWAAQKVKVMVRAKGTKECMERLGITIINNEVIECNKDHYVEVRNDQLEEFKAKENIK